MTVSRRELLASLGVAGAVGGLTGVAAGRLFDDTGTLRAFLVAGVVDLEIEWAVTAGPNTGATGTSEGGFELPLAELGATDDTGEVALSVALPGEANGPARVWLRTDCPPATVLGEHLVVTLAYANGVELISGSLREVADAFRNGFPLDGDSTDVPGANACIEGALDLVLTYTLADGYIGSEATSLTLAFHAVQCRNTVSENPFVGDERDACPVGERCPCCVFLGKLAFEDRDDSGPGDTDGDGIGDSVIEPGTYPFSEGDPEYQVVITDTVDKAGPETVAVAFRIERVDGGVVPLLCRVEVKADGTVVYVTDDARPDTTGLTDDPDGLLYAPRRGGDDGNEPGDFQGISHIQVFVCTADGPKTCAGEVLGGEEV